MTQVIKYKYKLVWVQTKRKKRTHLCSPRKIKIKSTKKECSLFLKLLVNSKTYQSANDVLLKLPLCTWQVLLCQRFCSYFSNHVLVALVGKGGLLFLICLLIQKLNTRELTSIFFLLHTYRISSTHVALTIIQ